MDETATIYGVLHTERTGVKIENERDRGVVFLRTKKDGPDEGRTRDLGVISTTL